MITLEDLSCELGAELLVSGSAGVSVRVDDVHHDSRRVQPGALFACVAGATFDGHRFAADAVGAGAAALLLERPQELGVPSLRVDSVRRSLGPAAAAVHGHPARSLDVVGVTGTNGKTSVVALLAAVLNRLGRSTTEIGTLTGSMTTPEATDVQRMLAEAHRRGARAVAMEVSSHALAQHRVDGCRFKVVVFTNLGRDHLDYHGSADEYFAAKARLFSGAVADHAVVDVSSDWGRRMAEIAAATMAVTRIDSGDVNVLGADLCSSVFEWRGVTVDLPLGGAFNRANAVLASEAAVALGMTPDDVAGALGAVAAVPGRFEAVQAGQDFAVIVDYAHTPEGLDAVLRTARELTPGRLVVVFGAGGDRDRGKRPAMGAVAARLADRVIVTSDNPRSEDPDTIIAEIVAGMPGSGVACREPDRRLAVRQALAGADRGDTVLIAGKGHETTQTIGAHVAKFDDREVARAEIETLLRAGGGR